MEPEQLLNNLKGTIEADEEESVKSLDHLLSGISRLRESVNKTSDEMGNIYFHMAKE